MQDSRDLPSRPTDSSAGSSKQSETGAWDNQGSSPTPGETLGNIAHDGYRASIVVADTSVVTIVVRLYGEGVVLAEERVWADDDTPANRGVAERLLPIFVATCRFLNTETAHPSLGLVQLGIDAIERMPTWSLVGLSYLATRGGGTDVVYDMPGKEKALRVVEDQFFEVLEPDDLREWLDQRAAEEDFSPPEEQEPAGPCEHPNPVLDDDDPSSYRCPDCGEILDQ